MLKGFIGKFAWLDSIAAQRGEFFNFSHFPPRRNLTKFGVLEVVCKESGDVFGQARVAFGFDADGVEIQEPRLEERPRHRLQRLIHPQVQLDLVVQRAEYLSDGALLNQRRERKRLRSE
jgi:hypothetical protein